MIIQKTAPLKKTSDHKSLGLKVQKVKQTLEKVSRPGQEGWAVWGQPSGLSPLPAGGLVAAWLWAWSPIAAGGLGLRQGRLPGLLTAGPAAESQSNDLSWLESLSGSERPRSNPLLPKGKSAQLKKASAPLGVSLGL